MTGLLLAAVLAPLAASATAFGLGWRRLTACLTVLSAITVLGCAVALGLRAESGQHVALGGLLRVDALSVTMLIVIGVVGTLATWAGIGYINAELADGHTDAGGARLYGALIPGFLAAMVVAVCANNIGVIWVAIEATTVVTAFLVGHRRTSTALEATWKYVILCSVGIVIAFLGTVLLYFAARHAGGAYGAGTEPRRPRRPRRHIRPGGDSAGGWSAVDRLRRQGRAGAVSHLAGRRPQPGPRTGERADEWRAAVGGLLGADPDQIDHRRRHRPRISARRTARGGVGDAGCGAMLTVTGDVKRMLAYSSMENMGLIAVAAAAGTTLAIAALLLHVLAHGIGKTVLFVTADNCRPRTTPRHRDITAVLARSRLLGASFAIGIIALLGLPPLRCSPARCRSPERSPRATGRSPWHADDRGRVRALTRSASACCSAYRAMVLLRSQCPRRSRRRCSSASPPRSRSASPPGRSLTCS